MFDVNEVLLSLKPDVLTITLDCSREIFSDREMDSEGIKVHHRKHAPEAKKIMATFYSTYEGNCSSDFDSLSKELYKVYQDVNHRIPILKLAELVNDSWQDRNVNQYCTEDLVKVGGNWKNEFWPL